MIEKINVLYKNFLNYLESHNKKIYYGVIIYAKIILDVFHIFVVSSIYPYEYYLIQFSGIKYVYSWILFLILLISMPSEEGSIKSFFLHIQFIISVLPMLTIYALTENRSTKYITIVCTAVLLQNFILKRDNDNKVYKIKRLCPFISTFIIFFVPLMTTVILIAYGSFRGFQAFDFQILNQMRMSENFPTIITYIIMWLTTIIIPFYMLLCIEQKKYLYAILLILDDLLIYMVWAHKTVYLSLIIILSVYIASKTKHLIKVMYAGINLILTLLIIMYYSRSTEVINKITIMGTSFIGDRFLMGPAHNKFVYYDIFSVFPKLYFSDGMIGKFLGLTNVYQYSSGQIAFAYVEGGRYGESNSCTGYLGDGYAQMGILGVLGGAVLLAVLVRFVERYKGLIAFGLLAGILAYYVSILNDTPLQTTFVSAGFFVFLILLLIYAESNIEEKKKNGGI